MEKVERTIRFYAVFEAETNVRVPAVPWDEVTAALAQGTEAENQLPQGAGRLMVGKRIAADGIALLNVSQVDLPKLYNSATGELRDLDEVMGDQPLDIAEVAYFCGFPNGVIGLLYNHKGPKARGLEQYLQFLLQWEWEIRPIPRGNILQAIEQAGEVKLFRVRVPSTGAAVFDGSSFAPVAELSQRLPGTDIEIIVRARGTAREGLARRAADVAQILMTPSRRAAIKTMRVELGENEDIKGDRALDLLEEHVIVERTIEAEAGRSYISESEALAVIRDAYRDVTGLLKDGLEEM